MESYVTFCADWNAPCATAFVWGTHEILSRELETYLLVPASGCAIREQFQQDDSGKWAGQNAGPNRTRRPSLEDVLFNQTGWVALTPCEKYRIWFFFSVATFIKCPLKTCQNQKVLMRDNTCKNQIELMRDYGMQSMTEVKTKLQSLLATMKTAW